MILAARFQQHAFSEPFFAAESGGASADEWLGFEEATNKTVTECWLSMLIINMTWTIPTFINICLPAFQKIGFVLGWQMLKECTACGGRGDGGRWLVMIFK